MGKRILALLLAACLLAGCSARPDALSASQTWFGGWPDWYDDFFDDPWGGWDFGDPWGSGGGYKSGLSETQRAYGSAGLVGWPSVLISIYLDERDGESWDEAEIDRCRRQLGVAVGWIEEQCAAYNAYPTIHYDDGTPDSGLFVHETYPGRFQGGEDSDEDDDFYDILDDLCNRLDTDELHQRYGTNSVGFVVFLPVTGSAFTMVHYYDDDAYYYPEYSCLYQYDVWSGDKVWDEPSTYAHELLHLYGAPDLYEDSSDNFVTPELTEYIQRTWPDAIMVDTYSDRGMLYDRIEKSICPLTAYRLGLCAAWPGLAEFPETGRTPAGVFTYENEPVAFETGAMPT